MNIRLRRLTVLALALVSVLALSATAAFAQEYPPGVAFDVSCTDATPGGTTQCTVVGAQPNEVLTVTASEDGVVFHTMSVTANDQGEASFSIDIPADVLGAVLITVEGPESGVAADTITVAPAVDGDDDGDDDGDQAGTPIAGTGSLPMTGGQVGILLVIALALLGGGLLALRRREDSKVTADA